jgi:metal-responsive CopG/Arc/MetJ family transcriptional regulator
MRTLVDIPDHIVKTLDSIARVNKTSRAEVIRQSLEHDLVRLRNELLKKSFGAWKDNPVDGLAFQRRLRDEEWD